MDDKHDEEIWEPEAEDDNIVISEQAKHMTVQQLDDEFEAFKRRELKAIAEGKR